MITTVSKTEEWNCLGCGAKLGRLDTERGVVWAVLAKNEVGDIQACLPAHRRCPGCGCLNHAQRANQEGAN